MPCKKNIILHRLSAYILVKMHISQRKNTFKEGDDREMNAR